MDHECNPVIGRCQHNLPLVDCLQGKHKILDEYFTGRPSNNPVHHVDGTRMEGPGAFDCGQVRPERPPMFPAAALPRVEVMMFANAMEKRLKAHDDRKDEWKTADIKKLWHGLNETMQVFDRVSDWGDSLDNAEAMKKMVDVANFLMFLYHRGKQKSVS